MKRDLLEIMIGAESMEEIRRIKRALDPRGILNRGNTVSVETAAKVDFFKEMSRPVNWEPCPGD